MTQINMFAQIYYSFRNIRIDYNSEIYLNRGLKLPLRRNTGNIVVLFGGIV